MLRLATGGTEEVGFGGFAGFGVGRGVQRLSGILVEDHDVQHRLALFDGINQALLLEWLQITANPLVLGNGQSAARKVNGDAREMGGSGIAPGRSSITIMAAQPSLLVCRPHKRVHLQGSVKLLVVGLAEILEKVAGPGPGVAARIQ